MYLNTLFGVYRHTVVNNQVDSAIDNHTVVELCVLVCYPPTFVPGFHVENRCRILCCLPLPISVNIAVFRNACSIKWLDGTAACHVSTSSYRHLSTFVLTAKEFLTIADVAVCRGGTTSKLDIRTGQCTICRSIVSKADSSTITAISRHISTIDSDGFQSSHIATTDASSCIAASSVDCTAIDGDAARDVIDIGVVSIGRILAYFTATFTAADTCGATSFGVIIIPRSTLSIDSAAVNNNSSQTMRNEHESLCLSVLVITQ